MDLLSGFNGIVFEEVEIPGTDQRAQTDFCGLNVLKTREFLANPAKEEKFSEV